MYTVNFQWDGEAAVWTATSEEAKGFVLESGSLDALMERVRFALPDFLDTDEPVAMLFKSERYEKVTVNG